MVKALGAKSTVIREAILANPGESNKPLAELINDSEARKHDGIHVTPNDVASQRQAMKKPGALKPPSAREAGEPQGPESKPKEAGKKKRGRPRGKQGPQTAKAALATES